MAKGTNAKIKELKGIKPEKITDEQLVKVQEVVSSVNRTYVELGRLCASQHNHLHQLAGKQDELTLLQGELKESYGTDDVDIQTGTINYPENGEANS
tara:strand:- start:2 stop:292 length:291 start_codon:yes stop_codon:yes gene_type:complete